MLQKKFDENSYQKDKENYLKNLLGNLCLNIDWIWIKESSRRKVTFQIDIKNRLGFFAEKSHNLIEINEDPLSEAAISKLIPTLKKFLKTQEENLYKQITITSFDNGVDVIFHAKRNLNFTQEQQLISFAKNNDFNISLSVNKELTPLLSLRKNQIFYPNFKIDLTSDIFIQATKSGLENIIKIIRQNIDENSKVIDLYSGFGAYSFGICDLTKSILAIEGDEKMTQLITKNAATNNLNHKISAKTCDLFNFPITHHELNKFDIAIINPPRNGAETQVKEIAKSKIKKVIYVSCNPQTFLRDVKNLIDLGFKIKNITAIDQFYKTNHLELVSILTK